MTPHRLMPAKKKENTLINLGFNIFIPALLLMKGDAWFGLSPAAVLIIGLAFPFGYGAYDLISRRKWNFFSIIGFTSVLLTGGIGLLELPKEWIAIKEAAIPFAFGIAILLTTGSRFPLVRMFLYNPDLVDVPKVDRELEQRGTRESFEKLMRQCTLLLAGSFFLSAVLNFILAKIIVQSDSGTAAFNEELSKLMLWSYPVIVVPCMIVMVIALWKLFSGIHKLTGLDMEDILLDAKRVKNED